MARKQNEIVDEEMPDDDGLLEAPAEGDGEGDETGTEGDPAAPVDGEREGRTLEPELPEEPAEELEENPEELPELTDEEAATEKLEEGAVSDEDDEGEPFEDLEGALTFKGAGVFVPEGEPLERLRASLGLATRGQEAWTQERTQLAEQVRELTEIRSAEADVAADLMELVFKDFAAMDEDALYEWAVNFKAKEGQLRNDIREKWLERREKDIERRASRRDPVVVERERAQAIEQVQTTIASTLDELYKRPELANLTKEDKVRLLARAKERAPQLTLRAADDSMIQFGIKKGEPYLNAQQMYEWALDRAEVRDSEKVKRGADKANARRLGKGKLRTVPGGAGTARSKAPDGEEEHQPAKTREEWLARMGVG